MKPATVATAAALLAAAWVWRRRTDQAEADQAEVVTDLGTFETGNTDQAPTMLEDLEAAARAALHTVTGTDAAGMRTSAAGLALLHQFESLSLTPYRLGDGGTTIGWGRFYPDGGPQPPARIDRATADAWFAEDVQERAEKWVKAYVTAPLTQPQFDALASMAYNLSPRSFRTIAEAVNAGDDPEVAALRFVRAGTPLERGLRRRRAAELAMYRSAPEVYA